MSKKKQNRRGSRLLFLAVFAILAFGFYQLTQLAKPVRVLVKKQTYVFCVYNGEVVLEVVATDVVVFPTGVSLTHPKQGHIELTGVTCKIADINSELKALIEQPTPKVKDSKESVSWQE